MAQKKTTKTVPTPEDLTTRARQDIRYAVDADRTLTDDDFKRMAEGASVSALELADFHSQFIEEYANTPPEDRDAVVQGLPAKPITTGRGL